MTPLEKFREQVKIAREFSTYVVQTADEAQAVLDEIDGPRVGVITEKNAKLLLMAFQDRPFAMAACVAACAGDNDRVGAFQMQSRSAGESDPNPPGDDEVV